MTERLDTYKEAEFGLDKLVGAVREKLARAALPPADGRVAEYPDARTLRYYQTIGVLDKPLRYEGRQAVYGYRHLLQALSVKLLQGQGYSLAQIQRALLGTTTAQLEHALREMFSTAEGEEDIPVPAPSPSPTTARSDREPVTQHAAHGSRTLIAAHVGPGISVILDPEQVEDPEIILARITQLLNEIQGGTG